MIIMTEEMKLEIADSVRTFKLPSYQSIPDVGFYLDQTVQYISEYLQPLEDITLTGSMISNYVKKGLIAHPVKKQYSKEQIAYLIFIAISKSALSIDDLQMLISLQKKTYTPQVAYDYFCSEFENILQFIFGNKDSVEEVGVETSDEKMLLRNTIITVAHKIYLDKCLSRLKQADASTN